MEMHQLDRIETMLRDIISSPTNTVSRMEVGQRVRSLLENMAKGMPIDAIKECRALTGLGLKDAKDLVEKAGSMYRADGIAGR